VLEPVGVTGTAARVYVELVETNQLSVAEAAERCGISVRRATTELRHIAALGLAFQVTGRPVRYRAVAPDLAISGLVAQREKELQDVRATMHRLAEVFQETSRGRHPDAQVEVVHGTPNIARVADRVYEQTQHQLRGFDRPPYSREPGTGYRMERSRLAAGVDYRVIYDGDALAIPGRMYDDILPSSAAGEQARTRPHLPIKLIISDDQLALIPAAVSRSIDTTFVIHRSPILDALMALFEAEWAKATPIPGTQAAPPEAASAAAPGPPSASHAAPDAETAALLAMLAAGMTDASIARSLSWSMRTTQRRMRQLMNDLGATSRFQAGVAAREKGWL
jgi:DNA-binding NarL/FixJ family response regulator